MIKVGLTGSIGMGKSTTAEMFREAGVPVYDADATVHDLYQNEAAPLVEAEFPGTTKNGLVDREELGKRVLGKSNALKKLEAIVHPLVHFKEKAFLDEAKKKGAKFVILDIPLLFETGGKARVDKIIVVTASASEQRRRVLARENMTEEKFASILARQIPDAEKRKNADYLIETDDGMEHARKRVAEIIADLEKNL